MPKIFYPTCDECGREFEAENDPTYGPLLDGHQPDDEASDGYLVWRPFHRSIGGGRECEGEVLILASLFTDESS